MSLFFGLICSVGNLTFSMHEAKYSSCVHNFLS
uniref:Uncharacterized protein n=1 Tax=Rhizophora mucronata TaxID=61149 RepID=A0A2P2J9J3_RHIMU